MKSISSLQNPLIKQILHLQEKSRDRKETDLFIIDGWKETELALTNGYEIDTILFRKGFGLNFDELTTENVIEISEEVFDKISYRGNTSKVVVIAKQKSHLLKDLQLKDKGKPLILVLDGIEKPGNLGAIIRTADAAGIDAVICCNAQTDIYNPNVIRSSVGTVFCTALAVCSKEDCLHFLKEYKISIFTTSLKASDNYLHYDYRMPTAFVLGAEANGVDVFWEDQADHNILIPMRGQNDSLNVSNTAAIILFEAIRQRN